MAKEFYERLAWARENAGHKSPRAAAKEFGWNENTYKSHENGIRGKDRPPPEDVVKKYARAFKVEFIWLYTGKGSPSRKNIAHVVGRIGAGAEIDTEFEQFPDDGLFEIDSLVPIEDGAVGFEVAGDSMWPRYDPGDVIVCQRAGAEISTIPDGGEAAVRTEEGKRFIKKLRRRDGGLFDLESHNAQPIRGVRIAWASPVSNVIRANLWKKLNGIKK